MFFTVTYKCKEGHVHEALFEPSLADIVKYFEEVKNIELSEGQAKYLSLEKLSKDPDFNS